VVFLNLQNCSGGHRTLGTHELCPAQLIGCDATGSVLGGGLLCTCALCTLGNPATCTVLYAVHCTLFMHIRDGVLDDMVLVSRSYFCHRRSQGVQMKMHPPAGRRKKFFYAMFIEMRQNCVNLWRCTPADEIKKVAGGNI